ncbi:zinc finger CCCH domain-containing protein 40-like [Vicia villosa]|uniref:zinc finger CCCH domain-containing protein 40-like n=1 Tax=Vicia villosa TaxID=3911 RepID=UPI00273C0C8D|nr:zinc finger CCCH domain-containing protein 40-like [Vicia villosa]
MAHRLLRDHEADGWERSDFPIICESCLGDSPYVRMTRAEYDKECKICTRPFTVFRWRPGRDARYKKSEICQTCSKLKNVCQVCLLDLEYGLPVQVRDTALSISSNDAIPKSDVNREYFAEEHDRKARAGIDYESSFGKARPNDTILKLQRTTPYYKRNRAHICSFYIRGECTRGAECPYRHEMPVTGELSQQNIKDRYYGVNDPVAMKLLGKAGEMNSLEVPEDESIKTLYIGGLDARVTEQDLRDNFYAHGEIESVKMVLQRACAFVTYTTREGAEKAAEELSNKLVIKGLRLKLMWGRPQTAKLESDGSDQARQASVAHSGLLPRAVISQQQNQDQTQGQLYYNNPPPQQERSYYPSMDPQRMGALIPSQDGPPGGPSGSGENKPSSEKQQMQHYGHPMMPPPHGQYHHQYYPPYGGYMQPVPPYQQYPPPPYNAAMPPSQPPTANHPYQPPSQPGSSQSGSGQAANHPYQPPTQPGSSQSGSGQAVSAPAETGTSSSGSQQQ